MQGIKATTESWEPKDLNNSSTARSDKRKMSQWPRGILNTWELPTHLQYTIPDAKKQLHLLLPTHEMWELPTPLIAAIRPSREMRKFPLEDLISTGLLYTPDHRASLKGELLATPHITQSQLLVYNTIFSQTAFKIARLLQTQMDITMKYNAIDTIYSLVSKQ
ncbi:hypothetical protein F511_03568 [Dorcoceras hygrometricum]|uniref:Uncharacterized protein n=1 Tax=Dorcoceras hygrometricum TaxID=472368 RepID=A0A2Z7AUN0_9LAMI|nr:hypothetical protein F511_03568 [Dorcoceras hygrometricum]